MPKIIHYRKNCIGCNSCHEYSPDNWEMDENDGKMRLKRSCQKKKYVWVANISEIEMEKNIEASKGCPVKIIQIIDSSGKKIAP